MNPSQFDFYKPQDPGLLSTLSVLEQGNQNIMAERARAGAEKARLAKLKADGEKDSSDNYKWLYDQYKNTNPDYKVPTVAGIQNTMTEEGINRLVEAQMKNQKMTQAEAMQIFGPYLAKVKALENLDETFTAGLNDWEKTKSGIKGFDAARVKGLAASKFFHNPDGSLKDPTKLDIRDLPGLLDEDIDQGTTDEMWDNFLTGNKNETAALGRTASDGSRTYDRFHVSAPTQAYVNKDTGEVETEGEPNKYGKKMVSERLLQEYLTGDATKTGVYGLIAAEKKRRRELGNMPEFSLDNPSDRELIKTELFDRINPRLKYTSSKIENDKATPAPRITVNNITDGNEVVTKDYFGEMKAKLESINKTRGGKSARLNFFPVAVQAKFIEWADNLAENGDGSTDNPKTKFNNDNLAVRMEPDGNIKLYRVDESKQIVGKPILTVTEEDLNNELANSELPKSKIGNQRYSKTPMAGATPPAPAPPVTIPKTLNASEWLKNRKN